MKAYRQANQLAKDRTAKSNAHWNAVEAAAKAGNPINAESFEWRYPSEKPEGYVREGDRYVFKGAEQAPAKDIRGTPPAPKGGKKGKADTVIADVPGGQTALTAPPAPQEPARPAIPSAPADEDASRQEALRKSKVFAEKLKAKYPPVDVRTDEILVQVEGFKQFKEDADPKTGVVEDQRLMGKPYSLAENPIVVMEMNDGRKVIVTGRHRLDLYKRNNIATIPAHIIRESDGWTPDDAGVLDAFLNILDEKGSIHDYVKFFDEVKPTASEAEADGLTSREKGRTAFLISQSASPDVRASINFDAKYRRRKENGEHADITAAQAAAIAEAAPVGEAPENEAIQREVLRDAFKGMTPLELRNRAQVYKRQIASSGMPESAEMDLFGDSGAGLREQADRVADAISAKQSELMDLRAVLNNALNRGDALQLTKAQAKALGITNVKDKAQLQKALDATKNELAYWSVEILDEGRMNQARQAAGVPVVDDVPKQPTTREVKTGLKGQTKTVPVEIPTSGEPTTTIVGRGESDAKPTLSLESPTTKELDAEASARNAEAVRKAMLERAASPLEGNAGDLTADLFGEQEGETPLFNARRDGQSADTQAAQVPGEDSSPKPAAPARFPRGAMANTVYNEDGVSYTGRILSEDAVAGTATIRATKERKKGLKATAGDYGMDKQGRQITKDVTVPAELVRVIDAVDSGARRTPVEQAAIEELDREANAQLKEVVGEQTPEVTDEIDAVAKRDDSENADPDAEYEGTRFRKVSQDDAEDTLADMRREYGESRLAAFEKSDGKGKAPWNYPSFARVKKIWQDYARMGFVRDERGMDDIAHNIVANIAAMDFETQMAGHSDNGLGASETLEEFDIEPWDEDKINRYYDWTGLHFSDYAMAPLKRIATQILMAESAEEQLILVDRVFNTVHMASDLLAENFIEGGAKALNALSGTGEHGDARNTRFRRAVTPDPDAEYEGTRFRRVSDPKLISRLENGKKVKAYRAMQLVDGKLYPPMAAKVNGEWINPTDLNTWLEAEELPQNAFEKNGRWYFKLDKGNGSSMAARYNPYFHSSLSPLNDQFTSASNRPNLVTVEVEIPLEDIESGYKADKAKDAVGEHVWKAGPVAAQLPASKARKVILSRYNKVVRIVPDSEVAEKIATLLEGEGISIPENVVTPSLKDELVKRRVEVAPAEGRSRSLRASNATVTPPDDIRFRIYAFHGTPHTFEPEPDAPFGKVKKEKVGTGEGAAAYGWGVLYAAESKGVAETYTKAGDPAQRFKVLAHELAKTQGRSNTVEVGGRVMSDYEMAQRIQDRDAEFIAKLPESIRSKIEQAERGNLYHVELDFDPEDTLDWHKPLSEQSDKVRQALFMDYGSMQGFNADPSGEQIYRDLSNRESANESGLKGRVGYEGENKRAASEYLASLGIKGIRYADQQSRTNLRILKPTESVSKKWVVGEAPNGPNKYFDNEADAKAFYNDELAKRTYNYVVFNEADIRVVGRNGETLTPTQAMDEQAAENDETRFRRRSPVTPEQDKAYMDAVERGDMEAAQRMVDEAARAAGYNVGPVWHGTRSKARPTEFDTNRQGQLTGNDIPGTYFTDTKEYARAVGMAGPLGSKYEPDAYYLRLSKMAGRDQENAARYVPDAGMERGAGTHRGIDGKRYLLKGRDGAEIRARLEAQGYDGVDRNWSLAHEWIAFSPSQIKSADPVTRDDAGRVVPLSERFNEGSNDIRFRVIPPANTTPSQEPPAGDELLKDSDYWNAIRGAYKPGESSRTKPIRELPELRVGMWRVSSLNGVRGRDIDQLRWLDPSTLSLAENMVERNEEGRGWDADRYADWNNQGLEAPPIEVVETDNGVFRVIDGHRRVAAAKKTGKPVLAWVSPSMDVPEGMRYDGDPSKPIVKTSLTIEAWRNGTAMRTEPLTGGFSDYGIANDIRFRKQTETPGNYRGQHRAPTGEFGEGSLDAMDRTYPKDIYDQDAGRIYGDGSSPILDSKIAALIRRLRGKPDAEVTVFRAVPKGVQTEIEPGNWVTPVREYAEMHGGRFDEGMDIIERKVKAGELFTEGNSLYEYGWQPDSDIRFRVGRGQTETPEFKAWFGNSAVVDADGKPLVVYHGTGATDIESFRPEGGRDGEWQKALSHFKAAQANNDRYGYMSFRSGTFFSPDPEYAGNYAAEGSGVLYPVYIKAKNPVYFDTRTGTATGVDKNKTPDALIIRDSGKILEIAVIDPTQIKSAIGNRGTFDPDNPDIRFRRAVTPEQDKAYMDAVERGDMETAQRMVDEAAKKAGYTTLAFKGMLSKDWRTGKTINTIKSVNGDWAGFFSSDKAVADKFRAAFATMGEAKTVSVYLDMAGADVVDAKGGKARDVQFDNVSPANRRNGMLDRINRSDRGVIVENTEDEKTVYIPKHPAQIKSADPVTYDDAGHVIPLSERFNDGSDDIRFRKQTETPEFKRWFRDSKVVDADGKPLMVYHGTIHSTNSLQGGKGHRKGLHSDGIWFSRSGEQASEYAMAGGIGKYTPQVYPVYLSIQNPAKIYGQDAGYETVEKLKSQGYDGAYDAQTGYWIAFDATQIKSATGNRGTFDPDNPDIRFRPGPRRAPVLTPDQQAVMREAERAMEQTPAPATRIAQTASAAQEAPILGLIRWGMGQEVADKIDRKLGDFRIPIKRLYERVMEKGGKFNRDTMEYAALAEKRNSLFGVLAGDMEERFVLPMTKALRDGGWSLDDLNHYAQALHAPDFNRMIAEARGGREAPGRQPLGGDATDLLSALEDDGWAGKGLSDAKAKETVDWFDSKPNAGRLREAAMLLVDMNRRILDQRVADGLMARQQAETWKNLSPYYVPLRKMQEAEEGDVAAPAGRNLSSREIKRAVGHFGTLNENSVVNSLTQMDAALYRGLMNKERQNLWRFLEANPDPDSYVLHEAVPTREVKVRNADGTFTVQQQVDQGFVRKASPQDKEGTIVPVKFDGDVKYIEFKGVNARTAARAVKENALQGRAFAASPFIRGLGHMFKGVRTIYAVDFMLRNGQSDGLDAALIMAAEGNGKQALEAVKAVPHAWKVLWQHENGRPVTGPYAELFDEYRRSGSIMSNRWVDSTGDNWLKVLEKEMGIKPDHSKPVQAVIAVKDGIERLNAMVELGTRFSVYAGMRKNGASVQDAADYARNITVDFEKKGELTPVLNSVYHFSNVAIQGNRRFMQAMLKNPARGARVVGGVFAAGFLTALWNMLGFDDDDDEYDKLKDYHKYGRIAARIPGTNKMVQARFRGIPGWIYFQGVAAAETAFGKRTAGSFAMQAPITFLDTVNWLGDSSDLLTAVLPPMLDPLAQFATNKQWTGRPLVPGLEYATHKPRSQLAYKSTPKVFKAVAEAINKLGGGDEVTKSNAMLDNSPEAYKYWWSFLTGSMLNVPTRLFDVMVRLAKGEDVPVKSVPFVRDFFLDMDDIENNEPFYQAKTAFEEVQYRYKGYDERGERGKMGELRRQHRYADRESVASERLKDMLRRIDDLKDRADAATGERKEQLNRQRVEAQRKFIELIERYDARVRQP